MQYNEWLKWTMAQSGPGMAQNREHKAFLGTFNRF
jgi:hypothetical protein